MHVILEAKVTASCPTGLFGGIAKVARIFPYPRGHDMFQPKSRERKAKADTAKFFFHLL